MSDYFNKLPNIDYVSRLKDSKINDYIKVKNLFRRGYIREDIFQDIMFFTKYKIKGDDRPDNVSQKVYETPDLDWLVLISNNIINIQNEWPLSADDFDEYLMEKYGSYETIHSGIHHYESIEVTNKEGIVLLPAGLQIDQDFNFTYLDSDGITYNKRPAQAVTNYQYESSIEDEKRNIFLLKPSYVATIEDDIENIMSYGKGSTQYVSKTLKRADNIKLFS